MRLVVVRHGVAIDRMDPACPPDPERFLTEEGIARTREAASGLKALGVAPDLLLTSPYVRAVQTAEIVAEALGVPKAEIRRTEALLPASAPDRLFRELAAAGAGEAICFGHAPSVDLLLARALGVRLPFTALKKAGAACVELDALSPPKGRLLWLATPKALRKLR